MGNRRSISYRIFTVANLIVMLLITLLCLMPLINVLAISFSDQLAVSTGQVSFWPVNFTTVAYEYLLANAAFWRSIGVTLQRVALGLALNLSLTIFTAYPLSKSPDKFPRRKLYAWYFMFTMLFNGGLIPTFLVVRYTGLLGSLWSLVLPNAVPIYSVILMLNFFRQLPESVSEAAAIDGAGHYSTLWRIIVPMSKPSIATIALFAIVGHWNEWFSAIVYMKRVESYPLQTYLQSAIINSNFKVTDQGALETLNRLSNKTVSSAQIFIGMVPVLCVYPFLQKYFTKGIVLGSVKG